MLQSLYEPRQGLNKATGVDTVPPSNFKRKWIKLWVDECLTGTIREDLTAEERSVWYDFLLLAGRNRPPGCISANENTPISPKRLGALLNIPASLVVRAISKFEKSGRIRVRPNGLIFIINWDKYQFTDYDRQKPYRQKRTLEEVNQQYLVEHPEKVLASVNDPDYDEEEVYGEDLEADKAYLSRGDESLEEHEQALMEQNPHVRKFFEEQLEKQESS